jgi:long-chain acyl-CoA synthetase
MTYCQKLVDAALSRSDRVAMTLLADDSNVATTFGSMLSQIRSIAFRLGQEQVDFGDRVAIIGENHPNWAMAYLGTLYRGAIAVPLDPAASVETLATFIDDSESKLAFISLSVTQKFDEVCERLGKNIPAVTLLEPNGRNGLHSFADWSSTIRSPEFDSLPLSARDSDMAVLIYTSGTTGNPKAVPLTHGNILSEIDGVQEVLRLADSEVILSLLPLFHAYSQIVNLWIATTIGARVVYIAEVNAEEIVRGLREGQVTTLTGVPRLWYLFHKRIFDSVRSMPKPVRWLFAALLRANGALRDGLGINLGRLLFRKVHEAFGGRLRLAVSAGSSFDASVAQDYHRLGFTILQGYGLTETAGAATITRFEDNKVGSVGTPLNNVEVKIDEPNGNGAGEVLIRGPIVMPGYYRNDEANREAFTDDGWFRSGDLGYFDRQGHLYIVGRKKDVIVLPSGKNVHPEDVEAHYARSPLVGELCVLGVRDAECQFAQSEKLCAVVVPDFDYLKANKIANSREAIRFSLDNLGRELPEYQRVHDYIVRAEPLPRTATRKVRRTELRKQVEESGSIGSRARDASSWQFSSEELELLNCHWGNQFASILKRHVPEAEVIHPRMNLELDLGLDSLARAECIVALEEVADVSFKPELVAAAHTVGDVIALANSVCGGTRAAPSDTLKPSSGTETASISVSLNGNHLNWNQILMAAPLDSMDIQPILRRKAFTSALAYLILRPVYLFARVFLRMEVRGLEKLEQLDAPYLICPNHQSFLDAVLVCSVYPRRILSKIFHVGASEYWSNPITAAMARLLNIVPVDPNTNLMRAMRAGAAGLRSGKILNIYPEGERSFDGNLHEFKKGAAILSTELGVAIVPVALDGVYKVWPRKSWRIRFSRVRVHFCSPISPQDRTRSDGLESTDLIDQVRQTIEAELSLMRTEH